MFYQYLSSSSPLLLPPGLVTITPDEEKGLIVTVDREKIQSVGVPAVGVSDNGVNTSMTTTTTTTYYYYYYCSCQRGID